MSAVHSYMDRSLVAAHGGDEINGARGKRSVYVDVTDARGGCIFLTLW
jgi:hypothetical protein